jgi:hypothetical protein
MHLQLSIRLAITYQLHLVIPVPPHFPDGMCRFKCSGWVCCVGFWLISLWDYAAIKITNRIFTQHSLIHESCGWNLPKATALSQVTKLAEAQTIFHSVLQALLLIVISSDGEGKGVVINFLNCLFSTSLLKFPNSGETTITPACEYLLGISMRLDQ